MFGADIADHPHRPGEATATRLKTAGNLHIFANPRPLKEQLMTASAHRRIHRALTTTMLTSLLAACSFAKLDSHAGTRLTGDGHSVAFSWEPEHPWAPRFQAQAAQFHLYAQYRQGVRLVEQDLGTAQPLKQGFRFALPEHLRDHPEGPVCLFISASRQSAAVPVRLGGETGDTARFRHPLWEERARRSTAQALARRELQSLETSVQTQAQQTREMGQALAKEGIVDAAACRSLFVAPAQHVQPEIQRLKPAESARRICVYRTRNMAQQLKLDIGRLFQNALTPNPREGFVGQLKTLINDLSVHEPALTREYRPELGAADEILPLVDSLFPLFKAYLHAQQPANWPHLGELANGVVNAYHGCVEDLQTQVAIKRAAEDRARQAAPERDRLYAEHKREECLKKIARKTLAEQDLSTLQQRLVEAKARVGQTQPTQADTAATRLNEQFCTP